MKSQLETALEKLQILITDKNNKNLDIIKSHSLEILLSYSSTPEFLQIVPKYEPLVQALIRSIDHPRLQHKILLLLVNLSSQPELANMLVRINVVKAMYQVLFETMRRVGFEHLEVTQSLIKPSKESEIVSKSQAQNDSKQDSKSNLEERTYEISADNIQKNKKQTLLDVDRIKFAIMVLQNVSLFSNQGRVDILEIDNSDLLKDQNENNNTEQTTQTQDKTEQNPENQQIDDKENKKSEFRNLQIVCDWVSHERVGALFQNFIFVLVNLTSDPELRELLASSSMSQFERIFENLEKKKSFEPLLNFSSVLRNLSFSYECPALVSSFDRMKYIPRLQNYLETAKDIDESQKQLIRLRIVDLLWVFHTNIDFNSQKQLTLDNFRFEGDNKTIDSWAQTGNLGRVGKETGFCEDIKVKLEGLVGILGAYSES